MDERECGVNDLSHEGRSSGSEAPSQCSEVGGGGGGLPWPSPPRGSDFRSRIQEAVMTTTRTETISLSPSIAFFIAAWLDSYAVWEEIKSFQGYILSSVISLLPQEQFVIVRNIGMIGFFSQSRLQVCL